MILYEIRHGETALNVAGKLQGWVDEPLNESGRELARITGEALKTVPFDMVFTSPLKRARETGELMTAASQEYYGRRIPIIDDDRLKEINWGSWDSLGCLESNFSIPCDHFDMFYTDPFHFEGSPDGDSIADLCERTKDFLMEVVNNSCYQDKTIAIATHGRAMRAMLPTFYEDKTNFWQGQVPYNCAVTIIEVKDGKPHFLARDKIYYDSSLCFDHYKAVKKEGVRS
ncbi:MAG: histidine phosphatase family protein [Clostridiales bacterium]|nr:histidine phosphatase family protein [Clostridiales bacterium]